MKYKQKYSIQAQIEYVCSHGCRQRLFRMPKSPQIAGKDRDQRIQQAGSAHDLKIRLCMFHQKRRHPHNLQKTLRKDVQKRREPHADHRIEHHAQLPCLIGDAKSLCPDILCHHRDHTR